jgi:hypothetical protein
METLKLRTTQNNETNHHFFVTDHNLRSAGQQPDSATIVRVEAPLHSSDPRASD